MNLIPETAGTTIVYLGSLPYSRPCYTEMLRPPYTPRSDPLELWCTCMDPSAISVEAVVVYETRDLDPQYARKLPVDNNAAWEYIDKVKFASRDTILNQCSNRVDLASIQHGEEVKSGAAAPALDINLHDAIVKSGYFTTVKHLKNPRWKWVEEVMDAYKPLCPMTYEREPVQTQQDDVADVSANQCCALA